MQVFRIGYPHPEIHAPESNAGIFTGCATFQDRRILIPSDNVLPCRLQLRPQIPQVRVKQRLKVIHVAPRKRYIDRIRNIRNHGESLREQRHPVLIQRRRKSYIRSVSIRIRAGCLTYSPHIGRRRRQRNIVGTVRLDAVEARKYRTLIEQGYDLVARKIAQNIVDV